ncbi:SWIM-type domain-containing protein [Citrus sinensis]|uniref:SWIM-type domain-containing protein n=1 Tax=Citrus sinensis TaxID=2711 RepID=A0ACB8L7A3_CITSI|nr:SWIM-type domain-containing protein [Citrus sinensis]
MHSPSPTIPASIKVVSVIYLHIWKLQPNLRTFDIRDEIEATYGVVCHEAKLLCATKRAKYILGMDHEDGYAILNQFKDEMERINSRNIVLLENNRHEYGEVERFKRMFVCWEQTSYAFKNHCRGLLVVDGWKINNPYNSVMLVAAALDGNNGILPIAFCEVEVEDLDSWVFFLKNINKALRLENSEGLCIMGDEDNGIDYAVEDFLPKTAYRQCCLKIFTEMVKRFSTAPVEHLFWSACRITSATSFNKYMDLIHHQSQECHDWLLQTDWSSWALFTIPKWVKCTCVTLSITDKLRNYLHQYLEMSIASRFVAIARLTAELFERRRMEVWNWYREKVTPTVREVIHDRTIDGQRFVLVEENGTRLKLTDTTSIIFDLNMEAQSCSCGLWQISGIPCAHACKGIQLSMGNVEEYVDNIMFVQNFCSMYAPGMMPLPEKHAWKWGACNKLLPPMIDSLKTVSMKGSNETASCTACQCIENNYNSATNNLQVHMVLEV